MFWLNAQVAIRVKVTKCEQTLLFIAMHYRGIDRYTSLEVKDRWVSLFPFVLPHYSYVSSNQWLSFLHLSQSAPQKISGFARPSSPAVPAHSHDPALRSPHSGQDDKAHLFLLYISRKILFEVSGEWGGIASVSPASYPGSQWAGKERAWYPLFAHALNFPEILGNRKLSCYIRTTVTT